MLRENLTALENDVSVSESVQARLSQERALNEGKEEIRIFKNAAFFKC